MLVTVTVALLPGAVSVEYLVTVAHAEAVGKTPVPYGALVIVTVEFAV